MVTRREAIANFLRAKAPADLAALFTPEMECQVNVARDNGEQVEGEYQGKRWVAWTDGMQTWKAFRIPFKANTEPEYTDTKINFDLATHAEGIGMTGWNWVERKSIYFAYDFDAIAGHSDKHAAKLSGEELQRVQDAACAIPWVTVRKSTSGNGLHLYVFLKVPIATANHTEHAALARAILAQMSKFAGFDFDSKVDNCGGNIWVWHRKFAASSGAGLKLIKQGEPLTDIPINWQDHVAVVKGTRKKNRPSFLGDAEAKEFEELVGQVARVQLDDEHQRILKWLAEHRAGGYWDADHHLLVCHTSDLKAVHTELKLKGVYDTLSQGREQGDINAWACPMRGGAWVVRRYTPGVAEAPTWDQDDNGWTRCYLNRDPSLDAVARAFGGIEHDKGGFCFDTAETAAEALKQFGIALAIPENLRHRPSKLKAHKDGRLIVEINKESSDDGNAKIHEGLKDWIRDDKKVFRKVLSARAAPSEEAEVGDYDNVIRHLVDVEGGDAGWCIKKSRGTWGNEPLAHAKLSLKALGYDPKVIDQIMGTGILSDWMVVNLPFQPEYPGNRQWNRSSAQLAFAPNPDTDNLKYDTWTMVLRHCGQSLDDVIKQNAWCRENGITDGEGYLKCWIASVIQKPHEPLPYLFFYGPQNSGKSTFNEAIKLIVKDGVQQADLALTNPSRFNGELQGKVFCYIEETDLSKQKGEVYNRIKDWVTGRTITIRAMYQQPVDLSNTTHWAQFANSLEACPTFPGDTRITIAHVPLPKQEIPKDELTRRLIKEAPDFIASLLAIEFPESSSGRLSIPVIETESKRRAMENNRGEIDDFISEYCEQKIGADDVFLSDFRNRYNAAMGTQHSSQVVKKLLPDPYYASPSTRHANQQVVRNLIWRP